MAATPRQASDSVVRDGGSGARDVSYLNYWRNRKPRCPHCDVEFDVWGNDNPLNLSYEDGGQTTFECTGCGKDFICVTAVEYLFSTAVSEQAADEENWGPQEKLDPAPTPVAHGTETCADEAGKPV